MKHPALKKTMDYNSKLLSIFDSASTNSFNVVASIFSVQLVAVQAFLNPSTEELKKLGGSFLDQYETQLSTDELRDISEYIADQIDITTKQVFGMESPNLLYALGEALYKATDTPYSKEGCSAAVTIIQEFITSVAPFFTSQKRMIKSLSKHSRSKEDKSKRNKVIISVLSVLCAALSFGCIYLFRYAKQTQTELNNCKEKLSSAEQQIELDYRALDFCAYYLDEADSDIELLLKPETERSYLEKLTVESIESPSLMQQFETYVQNEIEQNGWQYSIDHN